jgi:uncharacterized protein (DUF427 family)
MKAVLNKTVVAQSDNTVTIEGNHYFPLESIYRVILLKRVIIRLAHGRGGFIIR